MASYRAPSSRKWVETYADRLVELAAGKTEPPISDEDLRTFALNCARGGYPAFRNDDPVECAEAEFRDWRMNSL